MDCKCASCGAAITPAHAARPSRPRHPARAIARNGLRIALAGGQVAEVEHAGTFGAIVRTNGTTITVPYGTRVVFDGYRVPLVAPEDLNLERSTS